MFKVAESQCNQCLFSQNRIVRDEDKQQILAECKARDAHLICHKAKDVCCRGFYQRFSTNLIRIAGRLGVIRFVKVEEK